MYLEIEHISDGTSLKEILDSVADNDAYTSSSGQHYGQYQVLTDAVRQNAGLGELQIGNQSSGMGKVFENTGACTFRDPGNADSYVVFRGTQDGEWLDNGRGMTQIATEQQRNASLYFDHVAMEENWDSADHIVVTGHSKGANKAQFVTLDAKHKELIKECYSVDGQGFSPEAIEYYQNLDEREYLQAIAKMRAVNGEYDYVHQLGVKIIPDDQTKYLKQEVEGLVENHAIEYMFARKRNGSTGYSGEPNDEAKGPGGMAEYAGRISAIMMNLPLLERDDAAMAIMQVLEIGMGKEKTGLHDEMVLDQLLPGLSLAVPSIISVFIDDPKTAGKFLSLGTALWDLVEGRPAATGIAFSLGYFRPLFLIVDGLDDFILDTFDMLAEKFDGALEFLGDLLYQLDRWGDKFLNDLLGRDDHVMDNAAFSITAEAAGQVEHLTVTQSTLVNGSEQLKILQRQLDIVMKVNPFFIYWFLSARIKLERCGRRVNKMGNALERICNCYFAAESTIVGKGGEMNL